MTNKDLHPEEFDPYYGRYIFKLPEDVELIAGFKKGKKSVIDFFNSIPFDKHDHSYEDNKWSIKEVFQHLIDTERIFIYRCFRIARRDETSLAGFDQSIYMELSGAKDKEMSDLVKEFETGRENSICLLQSLTEEDLLFLGNSNGNKMSARAAAFVLPGHDIWHMEIIKERYL